MNKISFSLLFIIFSGKKKFLKITLKKNLFMRNEPQKSEKTVGRCSSKCS